MKRGDRVTGPIKASALMGVDQIAGERAMIKGPTGGNITRVGSKDDPVIKIKSESTGNPVLKRESQLRKAPKRK